LPLIKGKLGKSCVRHWAWAQRHSPPFQVSAVLSQH
jgi:hypothetical protein